jgi:hypothetical protein
MTAFQGAVDATFAAFGIDAVYTPAGGDPIPVRVIARRPDTIVGFGETRIHAETATFEVRASEVGNPHAGDQLTVDGETFVVQGEPERRDPDRLVWTRCAADVSGSALRRASFAPPEQTRRWLPRRRSRRESSRAPREPRLTERPPPALERQQ